VLDLDAVFESGSLAGSNAVESAATLMEFVAALHESSCTKA
jgi:hypothetical protein